MVSGFGKFHTNEPDPKNPKKLLRPYRNISLDSIRKMVEVPQYVVKSKAQWFIPSILKSRNFKSQETKGEFWMLWADLDENPKPLSEVKILIQDVLDGFLGPFNFEIYASNSATKDKQKGRILIPLLEPLTGQEWMICQQILNDKLDKIGIKADPKSEGAAQLCYLPNKGVFYESHYLREGLMFDPQKIWEDEVREGKQLILDSKVLKIAVKKTESKQTPANEDSGLNLIATFNETFSVEEILLDAGYDQNGNTFRHPDSESGSFSASVLDGRVHSLSSADPLYTGGSGGGAHDAFSAFRVLEHDGDLNSALKDAGDNLLKINGESFNKLRQKEYFQKLNKDSISSDFSQPLQYTRPQLISMIEATDSFDELTKTIVGYVSTSELTESERAYLQKLIAKKAKVSVASIKEDAKLYANVEATKDNMHLVAAREVIKSYGKDNLLESSSFIWSWNGDGVWRKTNEREVKQKVHVVAETNELTASIVSSILDMIKTESHKPDHRFDENPKTINCANGELDYKNNNWVLVPHQRDHFRTAMIPVSYDPNAKAPRFEQFLMEIFEGDSDKSEKYHIVLEALGYSLIPSCHLEKFFMLIGSGANGKSVLLTVLAELIGREYTSAVQPSQFENRFQRGHLQGKLANIITEIAEGAEIADAQLKSLVSGEMTTAEHKHKDPFEFVPYAKHWFGTNHLPHTRDFSDALFRRAIILKFNNKFDNKNRDVHLITKLKMELPGIFNLALLGLQRLIENNRFTECESSIEISKQWRKEADQAAQFVEDVCEVSISYRIKSSDLFSNYNEWASTEGIKRTLNHNNFSARLERLGFTKSRGSGGERMIQGLKLRQVGLL